MSKLTGKIALVTGASRGLGRGIAKKLASEGATVVVNYNASKEQADSLVAELGSGAVSFQANVTRATEVKALFDFIMKRFGRLDILVNNAGTTKAQDIFDTSEADWDSIIQTNLKSLFLCSKAAMNIMREQHYGRMINISSIVAHRGALFGHVHYAATKGGILSFSRTLARTGAPLGITVNVVAPGIIETELLLKTHGQEEIDRLSATVPLGLGKVADVGNAVAFLADDDSHYITGACLDVNGGMYFH